MKLSPQMFAEKWRASTLKESAAYQEHFIDLCNMLEQPTPASVDGKGTRYTFQKGVSKTGGGAGFADVWFRGHFAWEYKGKHKDLEKAYAQLLQYREDLENPPLLVVCDFDRFEVHTNFTNCVKKVYQFTHADLPKPENLKVLRALFTEPELLKPEKSPQAVTEEAAAKFARLADSLRKAGIEPHRAAHFLMKLLFCMFAEDVGLLKNKIFQRIVEVSLKDDVFEKYIKELFEAMAYGGHVMLQSIDQFNGGLFNDADVIELNGEDLTTLHECAKLDWSSIEPAIFGTLFERSLDPTKRSQAGAHYTSKEDILSIVEPVLMQPLRREWEQVKAKAISARDKRDAAKGKDYTKEEKKLRKLFDDFMYRLSTVKVLDPACGSGNFLYVSLNLLMDLEKEVYTFATQCHIEAPFRLVGPQQLYGIELNPYAVELAQLVVWIGYIQWDKNNGFIRHEVPILKPLNTIQEKDAILERFMDQAVEPKWPECEVIVGNPPFLGGNKIRQELGSEYVEALFKLYDSRVPAFADLCCYWFERARKQIEDRNCKRAGLLATQGIRGGANREVLKRIKETGEIFFAYSDRDWILDGATVHISMVGFDDGSEYAKALNGKPVTLINANLASTSADTTTAKQLRGNLACCFMGPSPKAPFDIPEDTAVTMLNGVNPHGFPNSDVIRPVASAIDLTKTDRHQWTIDFGLEPLDKAVKYEQPFEFIKQFVYPVRSKNRRQSYAEKWWQYAEARPGMRNALKGTSRFIATPGVSKHRIFVWRGNEILCNQGTLVFAKGEDYWLGVLHSRIHETWARAQGTQLRERESGFRYTPTSCFETFPLPSPTPQQEKLIAQAAKELDDLRNNWLNPPEWTKTEVLEFSGSVGGPWAKYVTNPTAKGIGTVRYPRVVAKSIDYAKQLREKTLTELYNLHPAWLDLAHKKLDEAVFAAYGWTPDISDEEILKRLLALNLERAKG